MKLFVFDIETVPDIDAGRRLHDLGDVPDDDVLRAMRHLQYQKSGSEFMPNHLQRVVAISGVYEDTTRDDGLRIASLGASDSSEADLIREFFRVVEDYQPRLVSWNGNGFDLPVLNYRTLLHGIVAPNYWDTESRDAKFNNYQSRYHAKHLDLMDRLSRYRYGSGLDDISKMLGLPGKVGIGGDGVADAWQAGRIDEIRDYCDLDVVNTYLVYLRYEFIAGGMGQDDYDRRYARLVNVLKESGQKHLTEFGERLPATARAE